MATVRPFGAVTYDPARVPDLSLVTCPPYDVISETGRDELYERHPYNVVRIISGRDESEDTEGHNKYTRACGFFRSWLWEGMLREDHSPALYVYRQAFSDPAGHLRRVWGLLGSTSLEDTTLAHEKTMAGPKADRLALMEAIPANLSPIYSLYREEGGGISQELSSWSGESPVADFTDEDDVRHTVWAVHDEPFHEKVASALAPCPLLIADGHHRFETAKAYRDLRRAADGQGPWDQTMTLLVDAGAQPVLILPYHRIVRRTESQDVLSVVEAAFDVDDLGESTDERISVFERELWESDGTTFALLANEHIYRLTAPPADTSDIPAGVLARRGLEPLGVASAEEGLAFTPSGTHVRDQVVSGHAACGFLIPPVDVATIWDHASTGGKMPEKSTYFFPKPRDGIVIRPLGPC